MYTTSAVFISHISARVVFGGVRALRYLLALASAFASAPALAKITASSIYDVAVPNGDGC